MIKWYLSRLKAMTPQEITYRVLREVKYRSYEKGKVKDLDDTGPVRLNFFPLATGHLENFREEILASADRICAGQLQVFGQELQFGGWRKDPITGNVWPQDFFARLNFRSGKLPGDVKVIWEINRQQFLPLLGVAYALTGNELYGKKILEHILSWISDNPRFQGINWSSSLELALRIISWAVAISAMQGTVWLGVFEEKIAASIYEQCAYIDDNLSLYSSANNHLIGELAGLICGCYLLGSTPDTEKWLKKSVDLLEKNIKRQFYPDGVSKEQAIYYQCYTMEYYFLTQYILQLSGRSFSREVLEVLEKACGFLNVISDRHGQALHIGDEDGGKVLEVLPENWTLSLLFWGAMLTENSALVKGKNLAFSPKLALLYGAQYTEKAAQWSKALTPGAVTKVYSDGGYWVKKLVGEDFKDTLLTFDFGPIGLAPLSAHGHSDILAFTLRFKDRDFFIDPGTYKYDQEQRWRNYFKSAMAHNILTVNEQNQLENLGPFLWGPGPQVKLYEVNPDSVYAGHYGYKKEGVLITRRLDYVPRQIKITDTVKRLRQEGNLLNIQVLFHLDAEVQVSEVKRHVYKLEHSGIVLYLKMTSSFGEEWTVTVLNGETAALKETAATSEETAMTHPVTPGWQSRGFYRLEATRTIVVGTTFDDKDKEKTFTFCITTDI